MNAGETTALRRTPASPLKLLAIFATAGLSLFPSACNLDGRIAGGSSEVDNPQIKVAFVDDAGGAAAFTGSVSLFLTDQNPALTPEPLLELQLDEDTAVFLNAALLGKTGASSFNLLARGSGGTGAFVAAFTYDSASGRVTIRGEDAGFLSATLVPLVRYTGTVSLAVNGPERVFVPGTPYQSVVVADSFSFDDLPAGTFPLRVYGSDGVERLFAGVLDTRSAGHFTLDSAAPPVPRDPPQPVALIVEAGEGQSVFANSEAFLSGSVSGVSPTDKRLGILWRRLPSEDAHGDARIENPAALNTRVLFTEPGVYRFVLSAALGPQLVTDTVTIGVQDAPQHPVFFNPNPWDTAHVWSEFPYPYMIRWFSHDPAPGAMDLQFSPDSGATWRTLYENSPTAYGFNERPWSPEAADNTTKGLLRLVGGGGATVATSRIFTVTTWTDDDSGGDPASWWKAEYPD